MLTVHVVVKSCQFLAQNVYSSGEIMREIRKTETFRFSIDVL